MNECSRRRDHTTAREYLRKRCSYHTFAHKDVHYTDSPLSPRLSPLTLYIDLASNRPHLGIVAEDRVVLREIERVKDDSALLPALERLLAAASVTWRDLTRIALVAGPGGFMSIRVGAALANALSFSLSLPSAGIHASDVWRARVPCDAACVWLHSTKRTQLFARMLNAEAGPLVAPTLITLDECASLLPAGTAFVGDLLPEHAVQLNVKPFEAPSKLDCVLPSLVSERDYQRGRTLVPWYGREA